MSNASVLKYNYQCTDSPPAAAISYAWTMVKFCLIFPLSVCILHHAYQQWRPQRSFRNASHCAVMTYHMMAMELIGAVGACFYFGGVRTRVYPVILIGVYFTIFSVPGHIMIHCLTCVDRYLAVVHPITYLKLRKSSGIKIRNISIFFIWVSCIGFTVMQLFYENNFPALPFVSLSLSSLIIVFSCSISVLKALKRPGPSNVSDRVNSNQSKRRASNTIMAILMALCFFFVGFTTSMILSLFPGTSYDEKCIILSTALWTNIPSCLVVPLLFLKRAGKLKQLAKTLIWWKA